MPRMARLVVPDHPHHITQRGSRRQSTFFDEADYRAYLELLKETKTEFAVEIWAYCLMPNHVHLVAVPDDEHGLAKMLGITHHRYARRVNKAHGWRGHLWQERFHSCVLDEPHLLAAVRYVELNPVCAGLCKSADEWPWSSVHANLHGVSDDIVTTTPMRQLITNWRQYLATDDAPETTEEIRHRTNSGRPAGDESFVAALEALSGRQLRRRKPGPSPGS